MYIFLYYMYKKMIARGLLGPKLEHRVLLALEDCTMTYVFHKYTFLNEICEI